ncbi:unnamed protein product [Phaedon cochleariae]|uniref:peptidylprolyl isomerase n=1 Tax=Phaedon cochleariae TaxID=80249 RepID=A0A9P0DBH6_PHACE|nr:unnamed protein product [Phaedon cochleariae]
MTTLEEPIKLKDLMEDGAIFTIKAQDGENADEPNEEDDEYEKNVLNFLNMQVAGEFADDDTYVEGTPFEKISQKMIKLLGNGAIKKRILRDGYGEKPQDGSLVRIHYNAYIELTAEPFDSTYARKKPHQFTINAGEVIPGLDISVQSMRIHEKSQFLIRPEYAYGPLGCLNRVPANTEVLFEIELSEIVNVGASTTFLTLPNDEQKQFSNVYQYCLALCAKAKDLYNKDIKLSIREYNTAVGRLEVCHLADYEDQKKQQELLLKLYSNLLVCYTRVEEPKKGCINFNKIRELVKGTDLKISAKCYFNNAKCIRMLGDYDRAKERLDIAYKMEPHNADILNEMVNLDNERKTYHKKQIELSKAMLNSGQK